MVGVFIDGPGPRISARTRIYEIGYEECALVVGYCDRPKYRQVLPVGRLGRSSGNCTGVWGTMMPIEWRRRPSSTLRLADGVETSAKWVSVSWDICARCSLKGGIVDELD